MSDILLSWLEKDAGLRVQAVEEDFANGFLWGQLFSVFNMQPDFDKFENRSTPDACIGNYTRLQPTFTKLGVKMNTRVANSMMRREEGVALRVLYSVKQSIGQVHKDLEKYKNSGRLGKELGASQEPNRVLLESLQYRTPKQPYEHDGMRFFEETMKHKIPASSKQLLESAHLQRFADEQARLEAGGTAALEAERASLTARRGAFRDQLVGQLASQRADKGRQLERDASVHASLMRRKEEVEKEEQRVELALAEAARRRKAGHVQRTAHDVALSIDTFEVNMKRLLKGDSAGEDELGGGGTQGTQGVGGGSNPLENQAKLREMAASTARLLEEVAGLMSGTQSVAGAARVDDQGAKREREARRRRMVVEQQAAAKEAERKAEAEALLHALARKAGEEQRLAARMWQLAQEKEAMRANRDLRERQYAERRVQDQEHALRRERELHHSLRAQYRAQTAAELAALGDVQRARQAKRAADNRQVCEGVARQLVQLAVRAAEYRERTGVPVPRSEWRRWVALLTAEDASLDEPLVKEDGKEPPQPDGTLARAAVSDWLACAGEFERPAAADGAAPGPIGANAGLGELVALLGAAARQHGSSDAPALPSAIQQMPLKLAVVGAPFSGKTTVAQALAKQFKLRLLEPEALVAEAVVAAKAWAAEQVQSAASAAAAAVSAEADAAVAAAAAAAGPAAEPQEGDGAALDAALAAATEGEAAAEGEAASGSGATPGPSRQVELGLALQAALEGGQPLPDESLVALVVLAMEETLSWQPDGAAAGGEAAHATGKPHDDHAAGSAPVSQGFVLDGFPRTAAQAEMLEKALTGLDLRAEQAVVDAASRLAPAPPHILPQLRRELTSGLDAVLVLGLSDAELSLRRALGRRVDPESGRVYHLEFDPPPEDAPGLAARLSEVEDASNDAAQVQQRLLAHAGVGAPLDEWHARFSRLRRPVDASVQLREVVGAAEAATQGVLLAKKAVASCRACVATAHKARVAADKAHEFAELARARAEGAAQELLLAKKAEAQAQALLDGTAAPDAAGAGKGKDGKGKGKDAAQAPPDPAAVELLKAQSTAKCAEALKECKGAAADAAGYAERAATAAATAADAVASALGCLGDAAVSATAEVDAKAAAHEAQAAQQAAQASSAKAEVAKQAADVALQEAVRVSEAATVEPNATLELAPPPSAADAAVPAAPAHEGAAAPAGVPAALAPVAAALLHEWWALERGYLEGVARVVCGLAERGDVALAHLSRVRRQFKELLAAPDHRAALVAKFQHEYNAVDVDALALKETQAELVLRAEELREAVWALCDRKLEAAEAERARVAADGFVADHTAVLEEHYRALAQVELDRAYATLAFIKAAVPLKHGLASPPAAPDAPAEPAAALSAPDLLSGAIPPELKDKLDEKSKSALPIPAHLTAVAPTCPALATALKVAYASGLALVAAAQPPSEADAAAGKKKDAGKGGKGDAGKGGKGGKDAAAAEPAGEGASPETLAAVAAEVAVLATREGAILEERLALVAQQAAAAAEGVARLSAATVQALAGWARDRYQAECGAALALDRVVKRAAVAGERLPAELRLEGGGTAAVVDEGVQVVPAHPGYAEARPVERLPQGGAQAAAGAVLSVAQLGALVGKLASLAPGGFVKVGELAEVLLRAGGEGGLSEGWGAAASTAVQAALRLLDPTHTGYVDWRQMLVCLVGAAFPAVAQATCADLADQCEVLVRADADEDGLLSEEEWMGAQLWFERRAFQPGSQADLEAATLSEEARAAAKQEAFDRARALKRVLWHAFSAPAPEGSPAAGAPRVDLRAALLYLCADRDLESGVRKAFSVAANSIASNARVDAAQLHKVAYPLGTEAGQGIHRCPLDQAALAEVVATIHASRGGAADADRGATVTAEQLLYGAHGGRVIGELLGRYKWQDLFLATRSALF